MASLANAADTTVKIIPTTLPTEGKFEGQLAYLQSTKTYYFWDGTAWVVLGASGSNTLNDRLPSIRNPPATGSSYDDEFNASSLDVKWTESSSMLTSLGNDTVRSVVLSGTPLTASIRDLNNSFPSWLLYQLETVAGGYAKILQSYTATTNATFAAGTMMYWRAQAVTADEGSLRLRLSNSGDANEWAEASMGILAATGERVLRATVNNNGVLTTSSQTTPFGPFSCWLLCLAKRTNDYHAFAMNSDGTGAGVRTAVVAKTGVTTFDQLEVIFDTDGTSHGRVLGIDFVRVIENDGLTLAFMNP